MSETSNIYKNQAQLEYTDYLNHQNIQITETSMLYKSLEPPGYTRKILVYLSGFCQTTSIYKLLKPLGYTKGWNNQDIQIKYLYIQVVSVKPSAYTNYCNL